MAATFPNKFPAKCARCDTAVSPGAGLTSKGLAGGPKWITHCAPCANGEEPTPAAVEPQRPTFPPTEEQQAAIALFRQGASIAIQAGAATGKTSTLVAIAQSTDRLGTYVAFNKAIVVEAGRKMPKNVNAATAHSLAFQQVGKLYRHRLDSRRQSSQQIARHLMIDPFMFQVGEESKVLQPAMLAGHVMKAISTFCNSADKEPGAKHFGYIDGIDLPTPEKKRTYANNDAVRRHLSDAIATAWADLSSTTGSLRFSHDVYLKVWELGLHGAPRIPGDFILFDEAQDASPVMLSVIEQQQQQVVFVGDAQQAIYEWRGAIDAMATVPADSTTYLTGSFRFGEAIAEAANKVLAMIGGAELRLRGLGGPSVLEAVAHPDAILTRSNAGAINVVLDTIAVGRKAHLVGGAAEVERFAKAAADLMAGRTTDHPELSIFSTWGAVQDYVAFDPQGAELAMLVRLIDDHGVAAILQATSASVSEEEADVVVSTAHKAKGREWDTVRLYSDFSADRLDDPELRLLYVALTRARKVLDATVCEPLVSILGLDDEGPDDDDPQGCGEPEAPAPQAPAGPAAEAASDDQPADEAPSTSGTLSPAGEAVATRSTEDRWWIGRCSTGCKFAVKLHGHKVFEDERYIGFFTPEGERITLPACPEHGKRPFMRPLRILPAKDGGRCNSSCQHAMKDECDCPCQGARHGEAHGI